jgi:hypothetical protein
VVRDRKMVEHHVVVLSSADSGVNAWHFWQRLPVGPRMCQRKLASGPELGWVVHTWKLVTTAQGGKHELALLGMEKPGLRPTLQRN